jgi:tRNA-dihydrouridine synthase A
MSEPELVADCVLAMKQETDKAVTVKHRTGIDNQDSWKELLRFVECQVNAGVDALIIHARKAWLNGLSPKQNREIPPLQYDWVYELKSYFPETEIIINGGIKSVAECKQHLQKVDGVMLGREPYSNPFMLAEVDRQIFMDDEQSVANREQALEKFYPYLEIKLSEGMPLSKVIRHIIGLYHGQPNGRLWRRYLSENAFKKGAGIDVIQEAVKLIRG